ncbi:MAG: hypothetical protein M0Z46_09845 [Actinomycetota bacterium]|nr:hypothetical protein [Actinomycetota bacterium]
MAKTFFHLVLRGSSAPCTTTVLRCRRPHLRPVGGSGEPGDAQPIAEATGFCTCRRSDPALVAVCVLGPAVIRAASFLGLVVRRDLRAGQLFAPAGGSLANELLPTSVRASVAGWYIAAGAGGAIAGLLCFGVVADVRGTSHHLALASSVVFLPMIASTGLLLPLPETRGKEPEQLWAGLAFGSSACEGVHPEPHPGEHHEHAQPRPVVEHVSHQDRGTPDPSSPELRGAPSGEP